MGRVWALRGTQQGVARCTHAGPWLDSNLFVTLLPTLQPFFAGEYTTYRCDVKYEQ